MMSDYEYEVFVSYARLGLSESFVRENLTPLVEVWLRELWHEPPRIFVDTEDVKTGEKWADKIESALSHSRILLAVWTPSYFRSTWCCWEWQGFARRAETVSKPLAIPILLADGEYLPATAKEVSYRDFRDYARVSPAFKQTPRYVELEDRVKDLCGEIASMLDDAPPEPPDWESPERPAPDPSPGPPKPISLSDVQL